MSLRRTLFLCFLFCLQGMSLFPRSTAKSVKPEGNQSLTYEQAIKQYQKLDLQYPQARLFTGGPTDVGKPLHLFVISSDLDFNPESIHKKGKAIMMINNGIHPGEPDGIDASLRLVHDLLENAKNDSLLKRVVLCIIPVYNIDGALNRGCCSRANQEGPEEYGFRANARNLDLNRDYIKADARNTRSFISLFRKWDPDVYADTHVSDGADYQYTMTLISTQHNKLFPIMGAYLKDKMTPGLFGMMKEIGEEISPYVNTVGASPETGLEAFLEPPRFGTGYTALFNTLGFVCESHMLKPFPKRVEATYKMLKVIFMYTSGHSQEILKARTESNIECGRKMEFPLVWKLDTTQREMLSFKGYTAKYKTSEVTGQERLYYDRESAYEKPVPFYNTYISTKSVDRPDYYVIPQAWQEVIDRLKGSGIKLIPFTKDTAINITCYIITGYESLKQPYEGHYLHSQVSYKTEKRQRLFYKGDYLIPVNQYANRYIVETLEPDAPDSYFCWGFFDSVLQQKEWFSDYVFEEKAKEVLDANPELKKEFEQKKSADSTFAADAMAQLAYIYRNSPYFENTVNLYPVFRINW